MTITYPVKHGIYVNMTNRCPCACTFCLRQNAPGVYGSDPLWLGRGAHCPGGVRQSGRMGSGAV